VNKPVDNRCEMRITVCVLWILSWMAEKQEVTGRRALRGACGGSRNAFTAGNGHHPGETPGTWEEPGDRPLARVPGPGGRRAAPAKTSQLASRCGEAGQGPSISYMEGPCLILPGRNVFATAARRQRRDASRHDLGSGHSTGEVLGRPRREAVSARAAGPATRPVQDGPSAGLQDWVPGRRARGVCPAGSDGRRSRIGRPEISEGAVQ